MQTPDKLRVLRTVKSVPPDERYLKKEQLMEKWQCSRKPIEKYVKLGMPFESFGGDRKRYNLAKCDQWREAYYAALAAEKEERERLSGGLHPMPMAVHEHGCRLTHQQ